MNRRMAATAMALAVIGAGLTACGDDPGAIPSPTTTSKVSSTPSKTPTPAQSPTPSEDPLFTEAKAVHLKYLGAMVEMDEVGGVGGLSVTMRGLVTGEFQATLEEVYRKLEASTARAGRGAKWNRISIRKD